MACIHASGFAPCAYYRWSRSPAFFPTVYFACKLHVAPALPAAGNAGSAGRRGPASHAPRHCRRLVAHLACQTDVDRPRQEKGVMGHEALLVPGRTGCTWLSCFRAILASSLSLLSITFSLHIAACITCVAAGWVEKQGVGRRSHQVLIICRAVGMRWKLSHSPIVYGVRCRHGSSGGGQG